MVVGDANDYCYQHDRDRADERRRNAQRAGRAGGRGRASGELAAIKALLEDLTARVLGEGAEDPLPSGAAAVANQLLNTRLRALELERKIKETEELEERLEALEREEARRRGARVRVAKAPRITVPFSRRSKLLKGAESS